MKSIYSQNKNTPESPFPKRVRFADDLQKFSNYTNPCTQENLLERITRFAERTINRFSEAIE